MISSGMRSSGTATRGGAACGDRVDNTHQTDTQTGHAQAWSELKTKDETEKNKKGTHAVRSSCSKRKRPMPRRRRRGVHDAPSSPADSGRSAPPPSPPTSRAPEHAPPPGDCGTTTAASAPPCPARGSSSPLDLLPSVWEGGSDLYGSASACSVRLTQCGSDLYGRAPGSDLYGRQ